MFKFEEESENKKNPYKRKTKMTNEEKSR